VVSGAGLSLLCRACLSCLSLVFETGVPRVSAAGVPLIAACSPLAAASLPRGIGLRLPLTACLSLVLPAGCSPLAAARSVVTASPPLVGGCSLFAVGSGLFVAVVAVPATFPAGTGVDAVCREGCVDGEGAGSVVVGFGVVVAEPLVSRGRSGETAVLPAAAFLSVHVPVDPVVRSTVFSGPATRGCGEAFCWDGAGDGALVAVAAFSPRLAGLAFSVWADEAVTLSLLTGRNGSATINAVLATPATNAAPTSTSLPVRRRPRE
jgi:hypothetical protein